ncbi:hypothetical protein Y1Q_0004144 [Alligator mississippiensis]|uniref:Uncharacterized protein n=1 Tax=Alligator mississippiensis TaxID=8496 RepID=A0A151PIA2_ALLMI|nr:hypothetical protein Y1Q_0004144 [Alligator mississippiensis]
MEEAPYLAFFKAHFKFPTNKGSFLLLQGLGTELPQRINSGGCYVDVTVYFPKRLNVCRVNQLTNLLGIREFLADVKCGQLSTYHLQVPQDRDCFMLLTQGALTI